MKARGIAWLAVLGALASLGAPGRTELERIAFSREVARPGDRWTGVRARALVQVRLLEGRADRLSESRLLRHLREARGVRRDLDPLRELFASEPPDDPAAVEEAALEAALTDPVEEAALCATRFVVGHSRAATLRIAAKGLHTSCRIEAYGALEEPLADDERGVLRAALGRTDLDERCAAAVALARDGDATGRPVLRAAATAARRHSDEDACAGLAALDDRTCVAVAIARLAGPVHAFLYSDHVERLTDATLADGQTWPAWLEANRDRLPPQVQ